MATQTAVTAKAFDKAELLQRASQRRAVEAIIWEVAPPKTRIFRKIPTVQWMSGSAQAARR
jgi:hypothetical protein